ncbi:MAG: hypothetical protein Q7T97_13185 [Burkholderiaceae bacterium]|nr:hypothetical protein [Burkholderiaceae bacterium]
MSIATLPPMRVPTLTEVVEWSPSMLGSWPDAEDSSDDGRFPVLSEAVLPQDSTPVEAEVDDETQADVAPAADADADAAPASIDESALTLRIVGELQERVDLILGDQLRAALTPMLERLMQAIIHEARDELALTLREVVAKAVSHELEQLRSASDRSGPV